MNKQLLVIMFAFIYFENNLYASVSTPPEEATIEESTSAKPSPQTQGDPPTQNASETDSQNTEISTEITATAPDQTAHSSASEVQPVAPEIADTTPQPYQPRPYNFLSDYDRLAIAGDVDERRESQKRKNFWDRRTDSAKTDSMTYDISYYVRHMYSTFLDLYYEHPERYSSSSIQSLRKRFDEDYNTVHGILNKLREYHRKTIERDEANEKQIDSYKKELSDKKTRTFDLNTDIPGMENETGYCFANTLFRILFSSPKFIQRIHEIAAKEGKLPGYMPRFAQLIENLFNELGTTDNTLNEMSSESSYHAKQINFLSSDDPVRKMKLLKGVEERYHKIAKMIEDILTFSRKKGDHWASDAARALAPQDEGGVPYHLFRGLDLALDIESDILGIDFSGKPLSQFEIITYYETLEPSALPWPLSGILRDEINTINGHNITIPEDVHKVSVTAPMLLVLDRKEEDGKNTGRFEELERLGYTEGYPDVLKFSINDKEYTYRLIGVGISHPGHATARFLWENGKWYHANDEFVTFENNGEFKVDPNASMLVYENITPEKPADQMGEEN